MGAPPSAGEVKIVVLRTVGGEVAPASALAPMVGPLGLSSRKIGEDICKTTQDWKGLNVTVKLTIVNRQATVTLIPSASSLLVKELKEPPRDRKKVISVARIMRERSMARTLAGTVKEILGMASSLGCTVNGEAPTEIQRLISKGEMDIPDD
ncbi:putative ribosomal protein L11/L12 [Plasmopara halstedii]